MQHSTHFNDMSVLPGLTDSQPQTCGAVLSRTRGPGMVIAYKFCMWYVAGFGGMAKVRAMGAPKPTPVQPSG